MLSRVFISVLLILIIFVALFLLVVMALGSSGPSTTLKLACVIWSRLVFGKLLVTCFFEVRILVAFNSFKGLLDGIELGVCILTAVDLIQIGVQLLCKFEVCLFNRSKIIASSDTQYIVGIISLR